MSRCSEPQRFKQSARSWMAMARCTERPSKAEKGKGSEWSAEIVEAWRGERGRGRVEGAPSETGVVDNLLGGALEAWRLGEASPLNHSACANGPATVRLLPGYCALRMAKYCTLYGYVDLRPSPSLSPLAPLPHSPDCILPERETARSACEMDNRAICQFVQYASSRTIPI